MPKLTLQKRCGNPNCTDPKCPYVIVDRRTVSDVKKVIKKKSPINWFTLVGTMIFVFVNACLITLILLYNFVKASGG